MALIRALETAKPSRQRLFSDPFARRFLPSLQRALIVPARLTPWRRMLEDVFDSRAPGARTSGAARTRLIDDWTCAALQHHVAQVVIVGAGFDCRGLRMHELKSTLVFELARRQMHELKSRLLADVQAPHIRRVPIDFLIERPEDLLLGAGYSPAARTLFVWEGVTNYLDAGAVDAVFDFFGRSAPGSRVIFTYVHANAIDGSFPAPGLAATPSAATQDRRGVDIWPSARQRAAVPCGQGKISGQRTIAGCIGRGVCSPKATNSIAPFLRRNRLFVPAMCSWGISPSRTTPTNAAKLLV